MLKHLVLSNARDQLCSFLTGFYEVRCSNSQRWPGNRSRIACHVIITSVRQVIPEYLLTAFDFQELELLLGGLPVIDVEDWKNNTLYAILFFFFFFFFPVALLCVEKTSCAECVDVKSS